MYEYICKVDPQNWNCKVYGYIIWNLLHFQLLNSEEVFVCSVFDF